MYHDIILAKFNIKLRFVGSLARPDIRCCCLAGNKGERPDDDNIKEVESRHKIIWRIKGP